MAKYPEVGKPAPNKKAPWHFHGSVPVAVDIEFTNLNPLLGEIFQFAAVPLNADYERREDIRPFYVNMKVECLENVDWNGIAKASYNRGKFMEIQSVGVTAEKAQDMLCDWVQSLELAPDRRLCPIAANWPNDRPYIQSWLGDELFHNLFHPYYRDIISAVQFINDALVWQGEPPDIRQCSVAALARFFNISNPGHHDALNDSLVTAQIYKRLIETYSRGMRPRP